MTTFKDYVYSRPNVEAMKEQQLALIEQFKEAQSVEAQSELIEKLNELSNEYATMANLVYIRASIDTHDSFYQEERDYFDEVGPELEEITTEYYKALIASPFREQLEEKWGQQLFDLASYQIKGFSPKVIDLMQKENKLVSEYNKLVASAQIDFNGETLTLAQLGQLIQNRQIEQCVRLLQKLVLAFLLSMKRNLIAYTMS
ncbi:Oligoendopeptidase F OS=Lysinibacillus sphaericus OX=1421 GN=LS41612_02175 PE=3 SV=1 [Lysinibacillus sphaericus]